MAEYVTEYTVPSGPSDVPQVTVNRVGQRVGGRFTLDADVWAVRYMGRCLTRSGQWEWEPQPSSRDDDFKARTRMPLELALTLARVAAAEKRDEWRTYRVAKGLPPEDE